MVVGVVGREDADSVGVAGQVGGGDRDQLAVSGRSGQRCRSGEQLGWGGSEQGGGDQGGH
jgi:hypothetical protein